MTPNMFFMDNVTPVQWCVFIFGRDTIRSTLRSTAGNESLDSVVSLPLFGIVQSEPEFRSWNGMRSS